MRIEEIKLIEEELKKIIPVFVKECGNYIYPQKLFFLNDQTNLSRIIDFGRGFGAWTNGDNIVFSVQNTKVFQRLARMPEYGKRPREHLVEPKDFIDNNKDYLDYMQYIIDNGLKEIDYCLDVLPHEIMHLIGSGGGVIGEGFTELRTRQICKKYGIRCAPIMHAKETKFIRMLERFVGIELLELTAFTKDNTLLFEKCDELFGEEFFEIYKDMESQYYKYILDYASDPIEHYKKYREIDFTRMYKFLKEKEKVKEEIEI